MKMHREFLVAALGLGALPLLLACEDPPGLEYEPTFPDRQMTVTIIPAVATIQLGESRRLRAILQSENGEVLDAEYPVAWSSSRPDRIHVTESGLVTGIGLGSAEIRAEGQLGMDETRLMVVSRAADSPGDPDGEKWEPEDDGGRKTN